MYSLSLDLYWHTKELITYHMESFKEGSTPTLQAIKEEVQHLNDKC
jgi:hypothetical protein